MRIHSKIFSILTISALSLTALSFSAASLAQNNDDELNSEIDSLQVQLKKADDDVTPKVSPKKKIAKGTRVIAPVWHSKKRTDDDAISALPAGPAPAPANAPRALDKRSGYVASAETVPAPITSAPPSTAPAASSASPSYYDDYSAPTDAPSVSTKTKKTGVVGFVENIIDSVAVVGMLSTSSLDGGAQNQVVPQGVNAPVQLNGSGEVRGDFNLGLKNLLLEGGVGYMRTGAQTGFAPYSGFNNFIYQDQVTFGYLTVPITAKYVFGHDPEHGGLYARAGIESAYLLSHNYQTIPQNGVSEEYRFGGYSQWDFMLTAAVGYVLNINEHFQAFAEISGYQGMIPVFATMNAYNLGFNSGLGLAYHL